MQQENISEINCYLATGGDDCALIFTKVVILNERSSGKLQVSWLEIGRQNLAHSSSITGVIMMQMNCFPRNKSYKGETMNCKTDCSSNCPLDHAAEHELGQQKRCPDKDHPSLGSSFSDSVVFISVGVDQRINFWRSEGSSMHRIWSIRSTIADLGGLLVLPAMARQERLFLLVYGFGMEMWSLAL